MTVLKIFMESCNLQSVREFARINVNRWSRNKICLLKKIPYRANGALIKNFPGPLSLFTLKGQIQGHFESFRVLHILPIMSTLNINNSKKLVLCNFKRTVAFKSGKSNDFRPFNENEPEMTASGMETSGRYL